MVRGEERRWHNRLAATYLYPVREVPGELEAQRLQKMGALLRVARVHQAEENC
jgi:hypothetical protein